MLATPHPPPKEQIDFLLPPTQLPGRWSNNALDDLAEQAAALSSVPHASLITISFQPYGGVPKSLAALASSVKSDLWVEAAAVDSPPYGGIVATGTPLHRFVGQSVGYYARILPRLHVAAARVQVIADTEAEPWNANGFMAHTDVAPRWDKRRKPDARLFDLTTSICTINPGTFRVVFQKPVPSNTGLNRYIKNKVGRNRGPEPRDFVRRLKASKHPAQVIEARAGKVGTMSSGTLHWRGRSRSVPDIDDAQRRAFLAVDLSFVNTAHNRRVLRAFARQQALKERLEKQRRPALTAKVQNPPRRPR